MTSSVEKHLELIQNVIGRLSQNSFSIRGWTITVISALLALSTKVAICHVAFIPAFFFWGLDAYYLRQERLFRKLYQAVLEERLETDLKLIPFSMDTSYFSKRVDNWFKTMFAPALLLIYLPIFLVIAAIEFFNAR